MICAILSEKVRYRTLFGWQVIFTDGKENEGEECATALVVVDIQGSTPDSFHNRSMP